jgi:hypothetical protein
MLSQRLGCHRFEHRHGEQAEGLNNVPQCRRDITYVGRSDERRPTCAESAPVLAREAYRRFAPSFKTSMSLVGR